MEPNLAILGDTAQEEFSQQDHKVKEQPDYPAKGYLHQLQQTS